MNTSKGLIEVSKKEAYDRLNSNDWNKLNKLDDWFEQTYKEYPSMKFFQHDEGLLGVYQYEGETIVTIQLVADLYDHTLQIN